MIAPLTTSAPEHSTEAGPLALCGDPYAVGLALGRARRDAIRGVLRRQADLAGAASRNDDEVDRMARSPAAHFSADDLEEVRGVAAGAGVSPASLIAHNLRLYAEPGGGLHFASTAALNGPAGLIHAASEDLPAAGGLRGRLGRVVQVRRTSGGIPCVLFAADGQIGALNGLNARGLIVTTASLPPAGGRRPAGRLLPTVVREVLERAADIDAAVAILSRAAALPAWSVCLSHPPTDRVAYAEFDGEYLRVEPARRAAFGTERPQLAAPPDVSSASSPRFDRLLSILRDAGNGIDAAEARSVLLDSPAAGVGSTGASLRRADNQINLVFEPGRGRVAVAGGPPEASGGATFREWDIADLFAVEPADADRPAGATLVGSGGRGTR